VPTHEVHEQNQGDEAAAPIANPEVVNIDDLEEEEEEEDEQVQLTGKRKKRLTSPVWKYFTKDIEVVEVNGVKYEQVCGYCNFPNCKTKYRAEGHNGTSEEEVDITSVIKKLYQFYASSPNAAIKKKSNAARTSKRSVLDNVDEDLENFLYSATETVMVESNELDKYMVEPLQKIVGEFDILAWWKNKREDYPILS
jgi:hypothetical protein